jgi:6-phosphogluconolactonase
VLLTKDGGQAFVTNTASGTVSSYAVANDGSVALRHAVAASTGAGSRPIDMALSRNGRFMFVLAPGNGTVRPYLINHDGTLTGLGPIPGLPSTAFGLAAF